MPSATTFRNKAETCRSLMRYVRNERTLRVLGAMIAENLAKAQEEERLAVHEQPGARRKLAPDSIGGNLGRATSGNLT